MHWLISLVLAATAFASACGAGAAETMQARQPSATADQDEASRPDRDGRASPVAGTSPAKGEAGSPQSQVGCFDQILLVPEPTSGGERLPVLRPCWTAATQPKAKRERGEAEQAKPDRAR